MEATTPIAADVMTATSMATTVPWGYCSQRPQTGRQSEVFSTALQEKPSWHWNVLQLLPENVEEKDYMSERDSVCYMKIVVVLNYLM